MTRTDGMVSSRSQTAGVASISRASHRRPGRTRRRVVRRELLALPAALALLIPSAPALAQTSTGTSSTGTSGYNQKPPTPKTETQPKQETAPSKEATTPTTTTPSPTTTTEPETAAAPSPKASTLPFTGLDLRWVVGAGVLLLAAGFSIRLTQRRNLRADR
jgi:uncharacterized membrane protein